MTMLIVWCAFFGYCDVHETFHDQSIQYSVGKIAALSWSPLAKGLEVIVVKQHHSQVQPAGNHDPCIMKSWLLMNHLM